MRTFSEHRALRRTEALIEELRHEEPEILNEILPALVAGAALKAGAGVVGAAAKGVGGIISKGAQTAAGAAKGVGGIISKGAQTAVDAAKGAVSTGAQAVSKGAQAVSKGTQTAVNAAKGAVSKGAQAVSKGAQAVGKALPVGVDAAATDGVDAAVNALAFADNLSPKAKQLIQAFQGLSDEDKEQLGFGMNP